MSPNFCNMNRKNCWGKVLAILLTATFLGAAHTLPILFSSSNFYSYGDSNHVRQNGDTVQLVLDQAAGAGFESVNKYLFGVFSARVKLVPGDSAGTVASLYFHSGTTLNDEIDFEFLGNVSGQPYKLHLNLFANGVGNREQQFFLWFDPTKDFHTYKIVWNQYQIVWFVDSVPVRIFKNQENIGVKYLTSQGLSMHGSIYDASQWATRGGLDKLNYADAPFIVSYTGFDIDGCLATNTTCTSAEKSNYWEGPNYQKLSQHQHNQLRWARNRYQTYDYCYDKTRYPTVPKECKGNR